MVSLLRCCIFVLGVTVCGIACAEEMPARGTPAKEAPAKKPVAEFFPMTAANWRGHQSMYHEGWRMVSSTEKALSYAKQHSIISSGQAISQLFADARRHSGEYGANVKGAARSGKETAAEIRKSGIELSNGTLGITGGALKAEWDYGSSNLRAAVWDRFYRGNMTLVQRTEEDRAALVAVPGDWYKNLQSDFRNLHELTEAAKNSMSTHIKGDWSRAFSEARADFDESYQQSGTRGNSLSGLGDVMAGWGKALYSGVAKPAARSAAQGAEETGKVASTLVFLPATGLFIVSGRTIESTGLTLYYTTSMGVSLVSPTVEGGLLTGLSMLSYGSMLPTAAVGGTAGVVNRVAVEAVAPAAGAGQALAVGAADTGVYAAQVSYDVVKGATKVTVNQAQSGIVLGYNALTAIPAQIAMGAIDAVFLVPDGARLVLASARGEVQWSGEHGETGAIPVQSLPVGSVIDLKALGKEPGVQVQVISDDPEVVQKVLEKLPEDLREGGRP